MYRPRCPQSGQLLVAIEDGPLTANPRIPVWPAGRRGRDGRLEDGRHPGCRRLVVWAVPRLVLAELPIQRVLAEIGEQGDPPTEGRQAVGPVSRHGGELVEGVRVVVEGQPDLLEVVGLRLPPILRRLGLDLCVVTGALPRDVVIQVAAAMPARARPPAEETVTVDFGNMLRIAPRVKAVTPGAVADEAIAPRVAQDHGLRERPSDPLSPTARPGRWTGRFPGRSVGRGGLPASGQTALHRPDRAAESVGRILHRGASSRRRTRTSRCLDGSRPNSSSRIGITSDHPASRRSRAGQSVRASCRWRTARVLAFLATRGDPVEPGAEPIGARSRAALRARTRKVAWKASLASCGLIRSVGRRPGPSAVATTNASNADRLPRRGIVQEGRIPKGNSAPEQTIQVSKHRRIAATRIRYLLRHTLLRRYCPRNVFGSIGREIFSFLPEAEDARVLARMFGRGPPLCEVHAISITARQETTS